MIQDSTLYCHVDWKRLENTLIYNIHNWNNSTNKIETASDVNNFEPSITLSGSCKLTHLAHYFHILYSFLGHVHETYINKIWDCKLPVLLNNAYQSTCQVFISQCRSVKLEAKQEHCYKTTYKSGFKLHAVLKYEVTENRQNASYHENVDFGELVLQCYSSQQWLQSTAFLHEHAENRLAKSEARPDNNKAHIWINAGKPLV